MNTRFPKVNLYEKLSLPDFASLDEIKKRYRKLILIYHPDRGGDQNKAKILNYIYDILMKHKKEYDEFLKKLLYPEKQVFYYDYYSTDNYSATTTTTAYRAWT